jgi:hypothetical protein
MHFVFFISGFDVSNLSSKESITLFIHLRQNSLNSEYAVPADKPELTSLRHYWGRQKIGPQII